MNYIMLTSVVIFDIRFIIAELVVVCYCVFVQFGRCLWAPRPGGGPLGLGTRVRAPFDKHSSSFTHWLAPPRHIEGFLNF